jgi:hypothetical protein
MANVIQIKRSSTHDANTVPTLAHGELGWVNGVTSNRGLYIGRQTDDQTPMGVSAVRVAPPSVGSGDIVTVGTIGTGVWNGTALLAGVLPKLNEITAPDADVDLNSKKITSLATCSADTDAANKGYVDSLAQGLDVKASVKLATAAVLPNNTYTQGQTTDGIGAYLEGAANGFLHPGSSTNKIDSVAVALNDRVLVKNENVANNGIYTVTALGGASAKWKLTRATDFDEDDKITSAAFTFVEQGTDNANSGFVVSTDGLIEFSSNLFSGVNWSQFSGAGQITAGDGLTKDGNIINAAGTTNRISVGANAIDISSSYVGQATITTLGTITSGIWGATDVAVLHGGTGASDAAAARTNLGVDAEGTDNSTDVTLAGTPEDYISLSDQALTVGKVDMSDNVTGTLPVGNGGTGATTFTAQGVLYGATTDAISVTAAGTAGQLLMGVGASGSETAPVWGTSLSGITMDCGIF